jgi:hypothetical protein
MHFTLLRRYFSNFAICPCCTFISGNAKYYVVASTLEHSNCKGGLHTPSFTWFITSFQPRPTIYSVIKKMTETMGVLSWKWILWNDLLCLRNILKTCIYHVSVKYMSVLWNISCWTGFPGKYWLLYYCCLNIHLDMHSLFQVRMVQITEMVHHMYCSRLYLTKVTLPQSKHHIKNILLSVWTQKYSICVQIGNEEETISFDLKPSGGGSSGG